MAVTFDCSHCGASVSYEGSETNINCPYCGGPITVPTNPSIGNSWKTMSPTVKIILVMIVLVVVVPTCVGLVASMFGGVVGICVPILVPFLPFLIHH